MTIYIAPKIKVGYRNRSDTYTGKLAYVIGFGSDNKWRKEISWNGWRDDKIDPSEFNNEPTRGFVLNKKAGDYKSDWNHRKAYCRVYDPRGFEFEINIDNLLFILENCSSNPGKALDGEFVYAWDGKDLLLLPTNCPDYKSIKDFSLTKPKKFSTKSLIEGNNYLTKSNDIVTYVGRYDAYPCCIQGYYSNGVFKYMHDEELIKNCFVFIDSDNEFCFSKTVPSSIISDNGPSGNVEELRNKYLNSVYYNGVEKFELEDNPLSKEFNIRQNCLLIDYINDDFTKLKVSLYNMYDDTNNSNDVKINSRTSYSIYLSNKCRKIDISDEKYYYNYNYLYGNSNKTKCEYTVDELLSKNKKIVAVLTNGERVPLKLW